MGRVDFNASPISLANIRKITVLTKCKELSENTMNFNRLLLLYPLGDYDNQVKMNESKLI